MHLPIEGDLEANLDFHFPLRSVLVLGSFIGETQFRKCTLRVVKATSDFERN